MPHPTCTGHDRHRFCPDCVPPQYLLDTEAAYGPAIREHYRPDDAAEWPDPLDVVDSDAY